MKLYKAIVPALVLSACANESWYDRDGDGYLDCRYIEDRDFPVRMSHDCYDEEFRPLIHDCDDLDAMVHPDTEDPCDGVDNDCDGFLDGADPEAIEYDCDGDGRPGYQPDPLLVPDCDDNDANRTPDIPEVCDGIDNNCDWVIDNLDGCDMVEPEPPEWTTWVVGGGGCQSVPGAPVSPPVLLLLLPLCARLRQRQARSS